MMQTMRTLSKEKSERQEKSERVCTRNSIECMMEMNSIRLQLGLIEAEDLAIKKMRVADRRAGGWALLIFGIGKAHAGMPGSRLVHPNSPFAMAWMVTSAHILLYSCLCSSYYVGFFWQTTLCDWMPPTLHFDMFVDLFFLLEIVLTFVTGVMIAGEYEDDMCKVASRYLLRGGFIIDLATSIPVSWVEWSLHARCKAMAASGDEFESGILRITRSSRVLRVLRLLRAFKFLSRLKPILEFVAFIGDYLGVPSYVLRVMKITMLIGLLVHLCTCTWWLIKTESNEPHVFNNWLEEQDLSLAPTEDLNSKYVIAFYFVNTVFCTIGFGDISGSNDAERLYCVLLFYLGVFVFGSLLVEVQEVISQARHASRQRLHELREMLDYLRSQHVPPVLARQMTQWYESHLRATQRDEKRAKFIEMAPVNLKRKLAIALHQTAGGVLWQGGMLSTVPLFMRLDSVFREDLLLDLFAKMTPTVYCPHVSIATEGFGQSCLYVICSGCVTVQHNEMVLATLHRGDSFGEDWLLLDAKQPRSEQASPALVPMHAEQKEHMRYVAVNEVLCLCLSSADFNLVVKTYDESVRAFFVVERARKKLEAKRQSQAAAKGYLDDSESDGEGSPEMGRNTVLPRSTSVENALQHQVARERWILLVRRAYNKYKTQHSETAREEQAEERAHQLEEAVNRAPSKRRASVTETIRSTHSLSAGEKLESCSSVAAGNVPVLAEDRAVYTCGEGDYGKLGPEGAMQGLKQDVKQMYGLLASIMSRIETLSRDAGDAETQGFASV